jgi:hypothetical protein
MRYCRTGSDAVIYRFLSLRAVAYDVADFGNFWWHGSMEARRI